jgi:PPK2 family polyphosphate:nucleotide phosphotransferase
MNRVADRLRVGKGFRLSDVDPAGDDLGPGDHGQARLEIDQLEPEVALLHEKMWAESRRGGHKSILVVLQGMDTSGKGGATKVIDLLVDPLGFGVVSFGKPTDDERAHHFLWRHQLQLPEPGRIRLFDRSHYEAVLVERVRDLTPADVWQGRYDEINEWEAKLTDGGMRIVKCMLHISKEEQKERLRARLEDPTKHWKYNPADLEDRALWEDYMAAYQDALVRCSTEAAPWYVIPSNHKWRRDWLIAHLLHECMSGMGLAFPSHDFDVAAELERLERT